MDYLPITVRAQVQSAAVDAFLMWHDVQVAVGAKRSWVETVNLIVPAMAACLVMLALYFVYMHRANDATRGDAQKVS
jgi:hypothetical protein